jgi:hypothetical protein
MIDETENGEFLRMYRTELTELFNRYNRSVSTRMCMQVLLRLCVYHCGICGTQLGLQYAPA